jgi:4-hydroxybenzoate polyprenyltransferase
LSALGAIVFTFLTIGSGMMHNGNPFPYLILTLVSIGTSILSGIIAKKRGDKTGKAFLGLGVLALGVLLFMLLFAG